MSEIIPVLLLGLHLMAMNVATGGPLVGVWLEWREQKGDRLATLAADYLAKAVSYSLLAGIFLGLALGWWSWSASYQSIWIGRLHYKLVWGVGELVFSLLITVGYLQWRKSGKGRNGVYRWLRSGLLVLNGTNLLYHFPSLFLLAGQLMATSELTGEDLRGAAFRERVATDGIPALVVHFGLASLAMGGDGPTGPFFAIAQAAAGRRGSAPFAACCNLGWHDCPFRNDRSIAGGTVGTFQ